MEMMSSEILGILLIQLAYDVVSPQPRTAPAAKETKSITSYIGTTRHARIRAAPYAEHFFSAKASAYVNWLCACSPTSVINSQTLTESHYHF